jgi:ferrochelatase
MNRESLEGKKQNQGPSKKTGLLLLNLGTPDSPEPEAVGRYLRQFLMDARVVDIPWLLRWFFVNVLIVPKRKHASSELYKTIWTDRGSPLLVHLRDLAKKVETRLSGEFEVAIGMRYGNPSIRSGLETLAAKGVDEILVFALYPQYAESSSLSSQEECERVADELNLKAKIKFHPAFYDHLLFIRPYSEVIREHWIKEKPEHLLMSFHGLPERHMVHTDRSGGKHCFVKPDCCAEIVEANRDCYRAQCYATARSLAVASALAPSEYSVSFQSRLGRAEWIKPYTEPMLRKLAEQGIKRLVVACPAFVADCLETLEEITVRGNEVFLAHGGEKLTLIPCLNSRDTWADSVAALVRDFG